MNKTINQLKLAADQFMPQMHVRQSRLTYSVCEPFTKNKEWIKRFWEKGDWKRTT